MSAKQSPTVLTPRRKVKAMLAAAGMRDDSDEEPSTTTATESVEPGFKPASSDIHQASDDEDHNAYRRVKEMLMSYKGRHRRSPSSSNSSTNVESASSDSMPLEKRPSKANGTLYKVRMEGPATSSSGLSPGRKATDTDAEFSVRSEMPNPKPNLESEDTEAQGRHGRLNKEADQGNRHEGKISETDGESNVSETSNDDQGEIACKLTQQTRPTRKAGKKAREEMNRETQRIARNMQLAHQAKTRKKYTTEDLLRRFNFGQPRASGENLAEVALDNSVPTQHQPSQAGDVHEANSGELTSKMHDESPHPMINAGKRRDISSSDGCSHVSIFDPAPVPSSAAHSFRFILPERALIKHRHDDDDLDIIRPTRLSAFDKILAKDTKEPRRVPFPHPLAQRTSPGRNIQLKRNSMSFAEMEAYLQQAARQQARQEAHDKRKALSDKGILLETEQEREQYQLDLDGLDDAREAARNLAKEETKQARERGEETADTLPDSEDDESYVEGESDSEEGAEAEFELSGSEDEEQENKSNRESLDENTNNFSNDGEVADTETQSTTDDGESEDYDDDDDDYVRPALRGAVRRNRNRIIDDDDQDPPVSSFSSELEPDQDKIRAAFGFDQDTAPMSLSLAFAGTMPDMNPERGCPAVTEPPSCSEAPQDEIRAAFGFTRSSTPMDMSQMFAGTICDMKPQATISRITHSHLGSPSQFPISSPESSGHIAIHDIHSPQSPAEGEFDDLDFGMTKSTLPFEHSFSTQISDIPDPTQDAGFAVSRTPGRFEKSPLPRTQATVEASILDNSAPGSPILQRKKGRLRRGRNLQSPGQSDIPNGGLPIATRADFKDEWRVSANAFDAMRQGGEKMALEKKRNMARGMIEEQAYESEDEYAGLGGPSDDDSGDGMDEEMKDMIDESHVKVDERRIAAFHAKEARVEDEIRIKKLYKDITNGNLRRKHGGDVDLLHDSDDEGTQRRARKQREYARMRKALLADERIGKIAENPKQLAFLRTIEDHNDNDPGFHFAHQISTSPKRPRSHSMTDSREGSVATDRNARAATNSLKRKASFATHNGQDQHPARQRRTAVGPVEKPESLIEDRDTFSLLANERLVGQEQSSASEDEDEDEEGHADDPRRQLQGQSNATDTTHPLFTNRRTNNVVDRLMISRSANVASSTMRTSSTRPVAFSPSNTPGGRSTKGLTLLRRAIANSSGAGPTSGGGVASGKATTSAAAAAAVGMIRRGGSKKSNMHYQSRESDKQRMLRVVEARRLDGLKKVIEGRGRGFLSTLDNGGFE